MASLTKEVFGSLGSVARGICGVFCSGPQTVNVNEENKVVITEKNLFCCSIVNASSAKTIPKIQELFRDHYCPAVVDASTTWERLKEKPELSVEDFRALDD